MLADDDARDLVEDRGAGAHRARRERRVERALAIDACRQAAGPLEAVGLAVADHTALLHAPVPSNGEHLAAMHECGADRHPALVPPDACLLDGQVEEAAVVVVELHSRHRTAARQAAASAMP
jgi:hypothetical protein